MDFNYAFEIGMTVIEIIAVIVFVVAVNEICLYIKTKRGKNDKNSR